MQLSSPYNHSFIPHQLLNTLGKNYEGDQVAAKLAECGFTKKGPQLDGIMVRLVYWGSTTIEKM